MPHAHNGRHGVIGLVPLLSLARERGLDPDALLRAAGIAPSLLADPQASVPVARVHALVGSLLAETGDEALGLSAARHYQMATFGLLGAVAAVTPSMREVIRLFVEFSHLTFTFFLLDFQESASEGRLLLVSDGDLGPLHRFYLDRELAFVCETARTFWPDTFRAVMRSVELDYPEPREAARYRAYFPCAVRFGARQARFTADLSADQPRVAANTLGLDQLKQHLRSFAGGLASEDELVAGVRRRITIGLQQSGGMPRLDAVAAELGLSERTLRRRLQDKQTSFRAVVDEVAAPIARRYLTETALTVGEVAERLGYSEPASFVRAFRRWTGTSPESYRTAHHKRVA
jgi:AraC-like DNA-binding protein